MLIIMLTKFLSSEMKIFSSVLCEFLFVKENMDDILNCSIFLYSVLMTRFHFLPTAFIFFSSHVVPHNTSNKFQPHYYDIYYYDNRKYTTIPLVSLIFNVLYIIFYHFFQSNIFLFFIFYIHILIFFNHYLMTVSM